MMKKVRKWGRHHSKIVKGLALAAIIGILVVAIITRERLLMMDAGKELLFFKDEV